SLSVCSGDDAHPDLPAFPTRRSSDLRVEEGAGAHRLPRRGRWALLLGAVSTGEEAAGGAPDGAHRRVFPRQPASGQPPALNAQRSEEHTSELQSRENLVCRLLLEKKK